VSCGNIYSWISQSGQHRAFAGRHFPVSARLVSGSLSYNQFASHATSLPPAAKSRYIAEYSAWFKKFGRTWEKMGCPPEFHVGEQTDQYYFTDGNGSLSDQGRMYLAGCGSCGLGGLGADTSDQGEDWDSDLDIGSVPDPVPPSGFKLCSSPPAGNVIDNWVNAGGGWVRRTYATPANVKFFEYVHQETNVRRWACTTESWATSGYNAADIKRIQQALIQRGYSVGSTGADGKIGQNTCNACFSAKQALTGDITADLTAPFFKAIGIAEAAFATRNKRLCAYYHKNWKPTGTTPTTPPAAPDKPVLPDGYHWCSTGELDTEVWTLGTQLADVGPWSTREVTGKKADGLRFEHAASKTVLVACKAKKAQTAGIAWILGLIVGGTALGMIIRAKMKKGKK
jgi:hypothetical protein